jgi:hypothetical protein
MREICLSDWGGGRRNPLSPLSAANTLGIYLGIYAPEHIFFTVSPVIPAFAGMTNEESKMFNNFCLRA